MSLRGDDWNEFADKVHVHIETYTIPQYGDKCDDMADNFTAAQCVEHIERYARRHGKNSRQGQEKLDLLKIAHYAQMAYTKLQEQEDATQQK